MSLYIYYRYSVKLKDKLSPITFLLFLVQFLNSPYSLANNLELENISIQAIEPNNTRAKIEFDASWENSWRTSSTPYNWDAIWIFGKVRRNNGSWQHLKLTPNLHEVPTGFAIESGLVDPKSNYNAVTNPAVGVFVHRLTNGNGTVSAENIRLNWDYTLNNVQNSDTLDVRIFAIEMVYIPQGAFYVGDNATSNGSLKQGSNDDDPWYIPSENAINVTNSTGSGTGVGQNNLEYYYVRPNNLWADGFVTGSSFTIAANYPKGYAPFYVMKYEITQRQYIDFFNTLTNAQKNERDLTSNVNGGKNSDAIVERNNISWSSGDAFLNNGTHGDVACSYLSVGDLMAYLDWSGLRPITELEFEKIARGANNLPISGEFVWGNTSITELSGLQNEGQPNESSVNAANSNFRNNNVIGSSRVGLFATSNSNRVQSGASFYGAMDLSGNILDRIVPISTNDAINYSGEHGDGLLSVNGSNNFWSEFISVRGGDENDYDQGDANRTSSRIFASTIATLRYSEDGGRGARSLP
jgi:formylglycine-generating enzyme required for sulfatase activity